MRRQILLLMFAAMAFAANSQFTLRPQVGFENSNTKISYNNLAYFSPITQFQPQFSLRGDYKFKSGFGPFAGLSTSRSVINYSFNDPEKGMTAYNASMDNAQLQLQGGLQYTSKPILLSKKNSTNKTSNKSAEKTSSNCSYYRSTCGHYYSKKTSTATNEKNQNQGWSLRLQPSAGVGYIPSNKQDLVIDNSGSQTNYTYNAGNLKTSLLTGMAFEFAKNKTRLFTVSVNYFKALGDNAASFTSEVGGKTTTTVLNSKLSGWNASIGIPISFTKKSTVSHKTQQTTKPSCQQYQRYKTECRYRCRKTI
jgi:hypothetical protein